MKTQKSYAMKIIRKMEREYECYEMRKECRRVLWLKLLEQGEYHKADLCKALYDMAKIDEGYYLGVLTGYKTMLRLVK